ncbi:MAG: RCC1 repeat-containing protein [Silvanigrellales bacterium]|nr:RCC1 repeat-containing protein [Silvanigrellales bacterium]
MRAFRSRRLFTSLAAFMAGFAGCTPQKVAVDVEATQPGAVLKKATGKNEKMRSRYLVRLREKFTLTRAQEVRLEPAFEKLEKNYGVEWTEKFAATLGESLAAAVKKGSSTATIVAERVAEDIIQAVETYTVALPENPSQKSTPPSPAELVRSVFEEAGVPFPEAPVEGGSQGSADALTLSLASSTLDSNCAVRFAGTVTGTAPAGASFAATSGLSGIPAIASAEGLVFTLPFAATAGNYTAQWNILDAMSNPLGAASKGLSLVTPASNFALAPPSLGMELGRQRPRATPSSTDSCLLRGEGQYAQIVAGANHTCALSREGTVTCWGSHLEGQMGNGAMATLSPPVVVPGLSQMKSISSSNGYHTCALSQSGGVKCWGTNWAGHLGDGTTTNSSTPVDVPGLAGVSALAAGGSHTCALTGSGAVKCWGGNGLGGIGNDSILNLFSKASPKGLGSATALATRSGHSCALTTSGGVKCWGYNSNGQLGDGTTTNRSAPVDVPGLAGVSALATGDLHTCVLTGSGGVKCWGYNGEGQLGDGTTTPSSSPVDVPGLTGMGALATGHLHTCALTATGGVKCWGSNSVGQLGDGTTVNSNTPVDVQGLAGVSALATGTHHTCALTGSGDVKCWGHNVSGQLGDGTTTNSSVPVDVPGLAGVSALATGGSHTCALTGSGSVKCWGFNGFGALGDGSTTSSNTPVDVQGLAGVSALATGGLHTCALTGTGDVKCWGYDASGQLGGDGTKANSSVPVNVQGLTGVTQFALGGSHTCVLTGSGGVKCWGENGLGQLGWQPQSLVPVQVDSLSAIAREEKAFSVAPGM